MDSVSSNIDTITVEIVSEIQREIDIYDIRSMVFLLYDVPYTSLERLTLLQRLSRKDLDLLDDWAKQAQSRASWRYEFLEALSICQLYGVIKTLGFNVESVKLNFLPNNVHANIYINSMKKMLYKVCENLSSVNFIKLKCALRGFNIDVSEYNACELVFLELMRTKFITIRQISDFDNSSLVCNVEKLAEILENLVGMKEMAQELRDIEKHMNMSVKNVKQGETENYDDLAKMCKNVCETETVLTKLKKDASKLQKEAYQIINRDRLGICYIINQESFHPSQRSIEMNCERLEDRIGSQQDKKRLKSTMEALNFQVIVENNLTSEAIYKNLKKIVKHAVLDEDSLFVLCVLSHGIEGCIYSADSVPVKIRDLQNILDGDDGNKLLGKPKVFIIQACQVVYEPPALVADSPVPTHNIRKADFLILYATVPEYAAYRDEKRGSVFVQALCIKICELADVEHIEDIFKKVNTVVIDLVSKHNCLQVCTYTSTLRKNLYLKLPN